VADRLSYYMYNPLSPSKLSPIPENMGIFNKFEEKIPGEKDKKNNSKSNPSNLSNGPNPSCQASQNLSAAAGNLNAAASNLKKSDTGVSMPQMTSSMGSCNSTSTGHHSANSNNNALSKQGSARGVSGNGAQVRNDSPKSDASSSGSDYAMSRQSLESSETDRSIHDTMKVATPSQSGHGQKDNGLRDDGSDNMYQSQVSGRSSPDVSRSARGGVTNGYGSRDNMPSAGGQKLGNNISRAKQYSSDDSLEDGSGGYVSNSGRQQNSNGNDTGDNRPGYRRSSSYYSRKNNENNGSSGGNHNSSPNNSSSNSRGSENHGRSNQGCADSPDYEPPRANFRSEGSGNGRGQNDGAWNDARGRYGRDMVENESRNSFDNPRDARQRGEEDGVRDAMRDMKIVDHGGRRGGQFNESRGGGGGGGYGGGGYGGVGGGGSGPSYDSSYNSGRRGNFDSYRANRDSGSYSPPMAKPSKFNTERKMDMAYEAGYKDAMEKIKRDMLSQFNS